MQLPSVRLIRLLTLRTSAAHCLAGATDGQARQSRQVGDSPARPRRQCDWVAGASRRHPALGAWRSSSARALRTVRASEPLFDPSFGPWAAGLATSTPCCWPRRACPLASCCVSSSGSSAAPVARTRAPMAPRPLDIDILGLWRPARGLAARAGASADGSSCRTPKLHARAFVLVPLLDVAPAGATRRWALTAKTLLSRLPSRGPRRRGRKPLISRPPRATSRQAEATLRDLSCRSLLRVQLFAT